MLVVAQSIQTPPNRDILAEPTMLGSAEAVLTVTRSTDTTLAKVARNWMHQETSTAPS